MEKVFEDLTRGRRNLTDSMKSGDDCSNFSYKSGDEGYIKLDKINTTYLIGSCCSEPGWRYPSQKRSGCKMDSY